MQGLLGAALPLWRRGQGKGPGPLSGSVLGPGPREGAQRSGPDPAGYRCGRRQAAGPTRYKHPDRIQAVLERHLYPTLGTTRARDVVPLDVDRLLVATVARGAPTVANDLLRYLVRLFKYPMVLGWATGNPAASFGLRDAGGRERARTRWLPLHELIGLARAMRTCERFGRENELGMWLLLALCVRKMELLSARWSEFDFARGVWFLRGGRTKTGAQIEVPLTGPPQAMPGSRLAPRDAPAGLSYRRQAPMESRR